MYQGHHKAVYQEFSYKDIGSLTFRKFAAVIIAQEFFFLLFNLFSMIIAAVKAVNVHAAIFPVNR